jgi:hypothetical protein
MSLDVANGPMQNLLMHRMIFKGDYRGFIIWQEAGNPGVFVRDPSNEWTQCNQERFSSIKQAEEYVDFVIEHYHLNKPGKTLAASDIRPVERGEFFDS